MFEILRLFAPVIHLSRTTPTAQTIMTSHGEYWIPARTNVYVNTISLGLDPEAYRNMNVNLAEGEEESEDDEMRFRPSRWVNPPGSEQKLYQPPKGSFMPWSSGPRVCPGQKVRVLVDQRYR
jgi:cytochrome P450